ncbi:MAG: diguanylate cyclase [Burkholderiales bacterium]|nr:diguanylate cyclase [Burkholderiales bacterium]
MSDSAQPDPGSGARPGELLRLLRLAVENIGELAVDDEWLHGQVAMLNELLALPVSARDLEDLEVRLRETLERQSGLKAGLIEARDRVRTTLAQFIDHLSDLTASAGEYHDRIERCAARLKAASDIVQLTSVVDEVMRETRQIQLAALRSRDELSAVRARVEEAEREMHKLQRALAQATELARHDSLTGLLNRKGLEDAMRRELARSRRRATPLCVALIDIDDFKQLNDTHGHQSGDAALAHLAELARATLRPQDALARYGGEEFVFLLPDTSLDQAVAAISRLQRELARREFVRGGHGIAIRFSAGVALLGADEGKDGVLARADGALYAAKRAGKNRVVTAN